MRALWSGIVDDAAVFPPGNAPLAAALSGHRAMRAGPHADLVGPLLVPAASVPELVELVGDADPLEVAVVGRPGTPVAELTAAVAASAGTPVVVVGLEAGWVPDWRASDLPAGLPVVLEVPRGADHDVALADVRSALLEELPVRAKLRTGPTPTWPWPDEAELADWLVEAAERRLSLKLTGGLHHALRGRYAPAGGEEPGSAHDGGEDNHGLLNVLLAAHAAADGSGTDHVRRVLEVRDAADLADLVRAWDDDAVRLTRSLLTAFGCCTVTDPLGELADLDLLPKD